MYVCVCKAVTDTQIKHAISEWRDVQNVENYSNVLGVGGELR